MTKSTISIIIPVFNTESYLDACVQSLLSQTYGNFELILVDDGSTDDCGRMCDVYATRDSRVRVIHQQNSGQSAARNAGLAVATGEYVSFVDSDDRVESDFLEYLVGLLETSDDVDLAVCGIKYENGGLPKYSSDPVTVNAGSALIQLLESSYFGIYVWNKLYRVRVLDDVSFPEGEVYEETAVITGMLSNCRKVAFGFEQKYLYMNGRPGSTMNTYTQKGAYDKKRHLDFMEREVANCFPEALDAFYLYAARSCCTRLMHLGRAIEIVPDWRNHAAEYRQWLDGYYRHVAKGELASSKQRVSLALWLHLGLKPNIAIRTLLGRSF